MYWIWVLGFCAALVWIVLPLSCCFCRYILQVLYGPLTSPLFDHFLYWRCFYFILHESALSAIIDDHWGHWELGKIKVLIVLKSFTAGLLWKCLGFRWFRRQPLSNRKLFERRKVWIRRFSTVNDVSVDWRVSSSLRDANFSKVCIPYCMLFWSGHSPRQAAASNVWKSRVNIPMTESPVLTVLRKALKLRNYVKAMVFAEGWNDYSCVIFVACNTSWCGLPNAVKLSVVFSQFAWNFM